MGQMCVLFMRHSLVRPSGAAHNWENPLKSEELWGKSASYKTRVSGFVTCHLTGRRKRQWFALQWVHSQNYYAHKLWGSAEKVASSLTLWKVSNKLSGSSPQQMDGITFGNELGRGLDSGQPMEKCVSLEWKSLVDHVKVIDQGGH